MSDNSSASQGEKGQHPTATSSQVPGRIASADTTLEIDGFRVVGLSQQDADFYASFSAERRKRLVRKIDVRLVPMLTILYLIAHVDRANIGNAKIEGLIEDLRLTGTQYNFALAIFFPPYILFMLPSNIALEKFSKPSHYLGTLISLWGVVMTAMGLVGNFQELVAVRFPLGGY